MKKTFLVTLFTLATLAWAAAQQPRSTPGASSGQTTSPSSPMPDASQSQTPTPGTPGPSSGTQAGSPDSVTAAPVTQGCLGGHDPNYTITDKAGTTYKLNIPGNADTSKLAQHVGESVNVAGNVKGSGSTSTIDVQGIGRGTGTCPSTGTTGAQTPPKP